MTNSLSLTSDNQTDVRCEYDPGDYMTRVSFDGPVIWTDREESEVIIARLTPDQMRSIVLWWTSNDPGERWTK